MNNDRQVAQGRVVRNPYAQMTDEPSYGQPDYPDMPATYEMNERIPVGRPIQPVQQTPYQTPPQGPTFAQPQMMMQQPSTLNYANNRDHPTAITCANCRGQVTTVMNKQPGKVTFAWALILGMTCGLCCVPFCVDSCLDKIHYCPRCGAEVGKKLARFI